MNERTGGGGWCYGVGITATFAVVLTILLLDKKFTCMRRSDDDETVLTTIKEAVGKM